MKRITKAFLLLSLMFSVITVSNIHAQEETEVNEVTPVPFAEGEIKLSRFELNHIALEGSTPKSDYLTGEPFSFYAGFALSADSESLAGSVLEVHIPKEFLSRAPSTSDFALAESKEIINNPSLDYYIIRYTLTELQAGVSVDFPVQVTTSTRYGETPNNAKIPVTMYLKDSVDGNNLIEPMTHTFTLHTNDVTFSKAVRGLSYVTGDDGTKVSAGLADPNKSGYLSTNLDDLRYVEYSFRPSVSRAADSSWGIRKVDEIVITDTLPEGAVFVQEANPDWTYDANTHTAKYTLSFPSGKILDSTTTNAINTDAVLKLKFPGAKIDDLPLNKASIAIRPYKQATYEDMFYLEDTIVADLEYTVPDPFPRMNGSKRGTTAAPGWDNIDDTQTVRNLNQTWELSISSLAKVDGYPQYLLKNVKAEDSGLDSRLKYTSIKFSRVEGFVGTVDIIVAYNDDSTFLVAGNVDPTLLESYNFDRGDEIKSVMVQFTDGSYLLPDGTLDFRVITELRDKNVPVVPSSETSTRLYNSAKYGGMYESSSTGDKGLVATQTSDYITYNALKPEIRLGKSASKPPVGQTSFMVNDVVEYNLKVEASGLEANQTVETNQVVDLLPEGFSYQTGSATTVIDTNDLFNTEMVSGKFEPTIVYNYKGTGRTALIWDLDSFSSKSDLPNMLYPTGSSPEMSEIVDIKFKAEITNMASIGTNNNEVYLFSDNYDEVKPTINGGNDKTRELVVDTYDFNENGDTTDSILKDTAPITYTPPLELIVRKEVKGSVDSNFMLPPGTAVSEIDSQMSYRLVAFNNSMTPIENLNMLDLVPMNGDLTVSEYLSLDPIARASRGSTFKLNLAGPISVPAGYKVYYNTTLPPQAAVGAVQDMKDYYNSSDWVDTVGDYSDVVAFKIVLLPGSFLGAGEEQSFDVTFDIPKDYTLDENDQVVNSFGVSQVQNGLAFFESNLSTGKIVKYAVDGNVWDDFNENGVIDTGEEVFKNHTVQLVDGSGNVVNDLDGNPYTTTTDANGNYHFDVYRQGYYAVKIVAPTDYLLTDYDDADNGSHIVSGETTEEFRLYPDNTNVTKNAGFYQEDVDTTLVIKKDLKDTTGVLFDSNDVFDFTVKINNVPYNGPAKYISDDGLTTTNINIVNGKVTMDSKHYVEITGINKNTSYEVVETAGTKYQAEVASYSGTMVEAVKTLTFVNKVVSSKVNYEVEKVWVDGPAVKPTIQVQLYRNGQAFGAPVSLTNGTTTHTWTDLDANDQYGTPYVYSAEETMATIPMDHTMKSVKEGEYKTVITNTFHIRRATFTVNKIWVNGPAVKPNIQVQLYRDGVAFGSPVTLTNGTTEYTWNNLDRTDLQGNLYVYTVDEITVLADYDKTININRPTLYEITNTYKIPKTSVSVDKTWVNGPAVKPNIQVQLYRDGTAFGTPVTLTNGTTEYTWTNLDKTDLQGKAYVYTVDEITTLADYNKTVSGNATSGFDITNTYKIAKTSVSVEKIWVGGSETRPDIEVQLYRDGVELGSPITLVDGETTYTWNDLDKTDLQGNVYVYTVDELTELEYYEKEVDGFTITNTYLQSSHINRYIDEDGNVLPTDVIDNHIDDVGADCLVPVAVIDGYEFTGEVRIVEMNPLSRAISTPDIYYDVETVDGHIEYNHHLNHVEITFVYRKVVEAPVDPIVTPGNGVNTGVETTSIVPVVGLMILSLGALTSLFFVKKKSNKR